MKTAIAIGSWHSGNNQPMVTKKQQHLPVLTEGVVAMLATVQSVATAISTAK